MRDTLISIFEKGSKLTYKEIKNILDIKNNNIEAELKRELRRLKLEGKIYVILDTYQKFPENYFLAIVEVNDEGMPFIIYNNEKIDLTWEELPNVSPLDKVVFAKENEKIIYKKTLIKNIVKNTTPDKNELRQKLMALFETGESSTYNEIRKKLGIKRKNFNEELLALLKSLELEGKVYVDKQGIYTIFPSNFFITEIQLSKKGLPYIIWNNKNYFFRPEEIPSIMGYEKVIMEVVHPGKFKLIKILERKIKNVVCEVTISKDKKKQVKVSDTKNSIPVSIGHKTIKKLVEGEYILVELTTNNHENMIEANFIKSLGHKNNLSTELQIIAINNGFNIEYDEDIEKELENIPSEVQNDDLIGRIDKRHDQVFTIDGPYTKDIDDAVEIKKLENGNYLLIVSIAHVSHYIKPKMAMWKFAEENTTSLYLIDSVLAMLHNQISNGICSLNPGVDRLARSFEMEINPQGETIKFRTYKSVIHSKKQMTYPDVNKILEDGIIPVGYEEFVPDLKLLNELSHILSKKRMQDGAVDFNNKEINFHIEDGILQTEIHSEGEAEKIIENCMVAANIAVGTYFHDLLLPFIYRNHENPIENNVTTYYELIKKLGYPLEKIRSIDDPRIIQKMIKSLQNKEEFIVLSTLLLKSMQRAFYSSNNQGHYGLAAKCYSQSTSPIRRFLDLVIHTLIDYYEKMDENLVMEKELNDYLSKICSNATFKERCADKAEYEANQLYTVYYMQEKIGHTFIGFISDITSTRICIKTEDLLEGYCYYDLTNTNYYYSPHTKMICNESNETIFKIGDKVDLQLSGVSLSERQIYFDIIEPNQKLEFARTRKRA